MLAAGVPAPFVVKWRKFFLPCTFFRSETIVASFLHSMVLLPKMLFNYSWNHQFVVLHCHIAWQMFFNDLLSSYVTLKITNWKFNNKKCNNVIFLEKELYYTNCISRNNKENYHDVKIASTENHTYIHACIYITYKYAK